MRRAASLGVALVAGLLAGCQRYPLLLPAPISAAAEPAPEGGLRAGFGRADITPPPGVSLAGNGPEGRISHGYRQRLFARALVLQDRRGEGIALVTVDLPFTSVALHRVAAESLFACSQQRLGADRLVLSATHSHSAPGNFLEARQYNLSASSVPGFDRELFEFLTSRIGHAACEAFRGLTPAQVAWGQTPIWGLTRNRSMDAFVRNRPPAPPPFEPPPDLEIQYRSVDPTWTMLRIDLRDPATGQYHPAGAWSAFAIHGTGNAPANDLLDADIHGIVERGVEQLIDQQNLSASPPWRGIHLLANGTEGDVSPDWPPDSRCRVPRLGPAFRPSGPRRPEEWEWQPPPAAHLGACLAAARHSVRLIGDALTERARTLFNDLGPHLSDTLLVSRAFRHRSAVQLVPMGLCQKPMIGTSVAAGAEDSRSRFAGWKLLGLIPLGMEEGGRAIRKNPEGCQREKNLSANYLQQLLNMGQPDDGFPHQLQFAVVRLGGLLIGAVPAEVTTTAGLRMKRAMRTAAEEAGAPPGAVVVLSHSNGFMQYVATDEEYAEQAYEGGSTIYGPKEAEVIAGQLSELTALLGPAGSPSPGPEIEPFTAYPGKPTTQVPRRAPAILHREIATLSCAGDTLVARWTDATPGRLVPANGLMLQIQREDSGQWHTVAVDDDPELEVRMVGRASGARATWEARYRMTAGGTYRMNLDQRDGMPELQSREHRCP